MNEIIFVNNDEEYIYLYPNELKYKQQDIMYECDLKSIIKFTKLLIEYKFNRISKSYEYDIPNDTTTNTSNTIIYFMELLLKYYSINDVVKYTDSDNKIFTPLFDPLFAKYPKLYTQLKDINIGSLVVTSSTVRSIWCDVYYPNSLINGNVLYASKHFKHIYKYFNDTSIKDIKYLSNYLYSRELITERLEGPIIDFIKEHATSIT